MDIDLKEVFSILDENDEGQIQLRRFIDVANNYYSDAEVSLHLPWTIVPMAGGKGNRKWFDTTWKNREREKKNTHA